MYWFKNNWFFLAAAILFLLYLLFDNPEKNQAVEPLESAVVSEARSSDQAVESPPKVEINQSIKVDIKGEVLRPGLYEMKMEERVVDLIEEAGGLTENADSSQVNLAQKLMDEMVVYVPAVGEETVPQPAVSSGIAANQSRIHINQATLEEIMTLNGIGAKKAEAILAYREENGPFGVPEDLLEVSGIGEATLENIRSLIQVP